MELQKAAQAFTGWFQLKVGGRTPFEMGNAVQPIVDVSDNYLLQGELAAEAAKVGTFVIGNSTSSNLTYTVPNGKYWRVLALGVELSSIAAADKGFRFGFGVWVTPAGSANLCYIGGGEMGPVGITQRQTSLLLARPLLLPPATGINCFFNSDAVLTGNLTPRMYVLRQEFDA